MASVMAIESEVFGSCVGEIDVSVEKKNRCDRLCCGCKFLRIILAGKVPCEWLWRWGVVPGIGGHFGCFGLD